MPTLEEIQANIDALSIANDSIDFVTLASQASQETSNLSFCTVKTVDMLPDLYTGSIPDGHIIYVDEVGGPVVSAKKSWIALSGGTVLRKDSAQASTYGWGWGCQGQLGTGTTSSINSNPINVGYNFCVLTRGARNTFAVTTDGRFYTTGCNDQSQLGTGLSQSVCTCVLTWQEVIRDCSGNNLSGTWCWASGGYYTGSGITTDGKVYMWGWSGYGLHGSTGGNTCAPTLSSALNVPGCCYKRIFMSDNNLFLIKADNTMYAMGQNTYGSLGIGCFCSGITPTCAVQCSAYVAGLWCHIAPGGDLHTLGIRTDGTLYGWGYQCQGVLGTGAGDANCNAVPTQVLGGGTNWCKVASYGASNSSAGIKTDGTLWTWGKNYYGSLGTNCSSTYCISSPVQIATGTIGWCDITDAYYGFNALTSDGRRWGWGLNSYGNAGAGNNTVQYSVPTLGCGSNWICLSLSNGSSVCSVFGVSVS